MQFHWADQQHIPGSQQIAAAFDIVLHIAGQEEIHFIKIVVVQCNLFGIGILIAKNLKSLIAHSLTILKALMLDCHKTLHFSQNSDE